jgi:hypothetical protein
MITINGKDVTGRVERVQAIGKFGRAWVLDINEAGQFCLTIDGLKGRWVWGIIREAVDNEH